MEREAITAQLGEMNALAPIHGLIIDHRRAEFEMSLEEAAIFAESIIRLNAVAPVLFICVVVSEGNRFIVDASVSLAAARGVPIRVYETRSEALGKIAEHFPQFEAPCLNRNAEENKTLAKIGEAETNSAIVSRNTDNPFITHTQALPASAEFRESKDQLTDKQASSKLSQRESECLLAAAYGLTEKETGKLLGISHNTVSVHIAKCREKLGARNKLNAVVKGLGLIEQKTWCKLCSLNLGPRSNAA